MKPTDDQRQCGLPEGDNCYGQIWCADLGALCKAALGSGPWMVKRCDRSQYDAHWRLYLEVEGVLELESDGPLEDGSYLFNGAIEMTDGRGERLLHELSSRLSAAGVPHRFELYNVDGSISRRLHHLWPEDQDQPDAPLWR